MKPKQIKPPQYNPLAMSSLFYAKEYAKKMKKYLKKIQQNEQNINCTNLHSCKL